MISVIIPTCNEIKNGYLKKILNTYIEIPNIEIICVDSESSDGTVELIKKYPVKFLNLKTNSRGERLSYGAKNATHNKLILHHPRSILPKEVFSYLEKNEISWGGFTHQFDYFHPLLSFTSWYSNTVRGDIKGIYYLDHCIYVRKDLLEKVNYLPSVDIFEDTILSERLLRISKPKRLPFISTTSAVRFIKNGIWSQAIRNQKMKYGYFRKVDLERLNKDYEKGAALNAKY